MPDTKMPRASRSETATGQTGPRPEWLILVAATVLLLLPFVGKPIHIDEPMYLWAARHIREHPLDFYGFEINWYGRTQPMAAVNINPPLVSFFLAGVSFFAGWSELALHLGMLMPAVALVLGTWRLARRFAAPPLLSALALLSLPGFLVSASTLMPDVLAAALWCWAVVFWVEALARDRIWLFACATLLAGACIVTKYVGIGLIPLYLGHGVLVRRRAGIWLAVPVVVALFALAYASYVHSLYGVDPFGSAGAYAQTARVAIGSWISHTLVGFAFLGGAAATIAFFAPWLWSWREIAGFGLLALILALVFFSVSGLVAYPLRTSLGARWWLIAHLVVFVCLGLQVAVLAVRRLSRAPDTDSILLVGWIGGIFIFAAFANWTTNVRSIVPALPAIAILLVGEARRTAGAREPAHRLLVPIALGSTIALVVAHADYALACATRAAAEDLAATAHSWTGPARFYSPWGFQHYMESAGVRKVDAGNESRLDPGTLLLLPMSGAGGPSPNSRAVRVIDTRQYPVSGLASTFSSERGSGFYFDGFGPVPFVFGRAPAEQYLLLEVVSPIDLHPKP